MAINKRPVADNTARWRKRQ